MKIRNQILVAAIAVSMLPLCGSAEAALGSMEQVIGVRTFVDIPDPDPDIPGLFYSTNRSNDRLSEGWPDQVPFFGWDVTVGSMADFNGDGIDDKVLNQPFFGGGWQTVAAYSGANGDISNTNLDGNDGGTWNWFDSSLHRPVYPDIDGDGIADNGIAATSPGNNDTSSGLLWWNAWQSDGNIGVPTDAGGAVNAAGWNAFGLAANDTPLIGDINGDGVDDRILYRDDFQAFVDFSDPNGGWGDGVADSQSFFGGVAGDRLMVGDINGDGFDDVVVYRDGVDGNGDPADFFNLFGYFTDPNGNFGPGGASVDLQGVAGQLSAGDYLVLGDLGLSIFDADFDQNDVVDGADFLRWQRNSGAAGQTNNSLGDANADTDVNGLDLANWESQYGSSLAVSSNLATVPEPSTMALCFVASMGLFLSKRRKG